MSNLTPSNSMSNAIGDTSVPERHRLYLGIVFPADVNVQPVYMFFSLSSDGNKVLEAACKAAGLMMDRGKLAGSPDKLNLFTLKGHVLRLDLDLGAHVPSTLQPSSWVILEKGNRISSQRLEAIRGAADVALSGPSHGQGHLGAEVHDASHGKLPMPPKRSAKSPPKTPPRPLPAAQQQQQHVAPSVSSASRTYTCAFNATVEERFNDWSTSMYASNIFLHDIGASARQEQRDRIRKALEVEWRAAGLPVFEESHIDFSGHDRRLRDGERQGTPSQDLILLITLIVLLSGFVGVILSICLPPSSPRSHQWTPPHSRGGGASANDYEDLMGHRWTPPHSRGGGASTSDSKDLVALQRGRPRVGQSVRIVGDAYAFRKGETGTLIQDTGSTVMPFKVEFPDSITWWYSATQVEPAPYFAVVTSVLGFGLSVAFWGVFRGVAEQWVEDQWDRYMDR
jgi:hypothetical protein